MKQNKMPCFVIIKVRDLPRPDLGLNNGPLLIQCWAKSSQDGVYHSKLFISTFWRKFHENLITKLQMNENLHKNVNENMFSFTF